MYPFPGHVAMSLAGTSWLGLPHAPALAATLLVDIVDKTLDDVLGLTPYGRCWMHTLLGVAVLTGVVWYWKGRAWGLSWLTGHSLHLVGDLGSFIPWFYPFVQYRHGNSYNAVQAVADLADGAARAASGGGWQLSELALRTFPPGMVGSELAMFVLVAAQLRLEGDERRRLRLALGGLFIACAALRLYFSFARH